jgi:hypothetical protein
MSTNVSDIPPSPTESDLVEFHDRVAEAVSIARAAVADVVTALASVTVAIVGAAVTVATADLHETSLATAMLIAIGGAGLSALVIIISLTVEAIRANKYAVRWQSLYSKFYDKAEASQELPTIPWQELRFARMSVGIHWKVSLPVALFLIGLLVSGSAPGVMRWYR